MRGALAPSLLAFGLFACGDVDPPRFLIHWGDYRKLEAGEDPWAGERPDLIECSTTVGFYPEGEGLEVDTGRCNYLSLELVTLTPILQGEQVTGQVSHFDLSAPEEAVAHVALALEGEILFERRVAIPGPADVYDFSFVSDRDLAAGSRLHLHLHNHGQNTWKFGALEVSRPAEK